MHTWHFPRCQSVSQYTFASHLGLDTWLTLIFRVSTQHHMQTFKEKVGDVLKVIMPEDLYLAGQLKSAAYTDLDLAAFITDTNRTLEWAAAGFNSTLQYAIPGSICAQNTTRQSICEAGLAELKPGERYFLWVASGYALLLFILQSIKWTLWFNV